MVSNTNSNADENGEKNTPPKGTPPLIPGTSKTWFEHKLGAKLVKNPVAIAYWSDRNNRERMAPRRLYQMGRRLAMGELEAPEGYEETVQETTVEESVNRAANMWQGVLTGLEGLRGLLNFAEGNPREGMYTADDIRSLAWQIHEEIKGNWQRNHISSLLRIAEDSDYIGQNQEDLEIFLQHLTTFGPVIVNCIRRVNKTLLGEDNKATDEQTEEFMQRLDDTGYMYLEAHSDTLPNTTIEIENTFPSIEPLAKPEFASCLAFEDINNTGPGVVNRRPTAATVLCYTFMSDEEVVEDANQKNDENAPGAAKNKSVAKGTTSQGKEKTGKKDKKHTMRKTKTELVEKIKRKYNRMKMQKSLKRAAQSKKKDRKDSKDSKDKGKNEVKAKRKLVF